jgi:predicted HNH restriction endonuclease
MAQRTRNPKWSREELILALDFYYQVKERFPSGASDPRVHDLSRRLNQLARPDGVSDEAKFRNPNGALMKLMNFRRLDPEFLSQGKTGLKHGGKLEEVIWQEFFDQPGALQRAVSRIAPPTNSETRLSPSVKLVQHQGAIESGSYGEQPDASINTWIFQANPDTFDIDSYLETCYAEGEPIRWVVRQYSSTVRAGDKVFIWRSAGKKRGASGVIASGWIHSNPEVMSDDSGGLWSEGEMPDETRVSLIINEIRLCPEEGMLLTESFKADPILQDLRILKLRAETNYLLPAEQASELDSRWQIKSEGPDQADPNPGFKEGNKKERLHIRRERNRTLVETAKRLFIDKHGRLFCEACGFNAVDAYRLPERALIEAHHKVAVSDLTAGSYTRVEDLVMLCPNCHRAVHHRRPWLTVDELISLIRKK